MARSEPPSAARSEARSDGRSDLRVLIVGDERKGGSRELVDQFCSWLGPRTADVRSVLDREAPLPSKDADLVVVFGGDGSILGAVRRMGHDQRPTLGINLGGLGFLTAFGHDEAKPAVELALSGQLHEKRRLLLSCHVQQPDGAADEPMLILNDGVLSRASKASIVTLAALRDGDEVATYSGDGLIVATPVGSTAYSLAAGGPILAPGMDALVVTPLASHSLAVRPLVMPVEEGLDLLVQDAGGEDGCPFVLDGQVVRRVPPGGRACFRRAPVRFRHLTRGPGSFYAVLREKLGWADLPRQRVKSRG